MSKAELKEDCKTQIEEMGSVTTQSQQLQQHVAVSRKRSSQQGDDEYSENSKRPKEKTETAKADLEDGANMSIQVEKVTVLSQQCISTGVRKFSSLFSCRSNLAFLLSFRGGNTLVKRERCSE